jgi:uncharacterized protein
MARAETFRTCAIQGGEYGFQSIAAAAANARFQPSQQEDTMALEKHDLIHEFPEYREKIHELKVHNPQFAKLYESYNDTDRMVYRIETGAENTSDDFLEHQKKTRLHLKDQLYRLLQA